MPLILIQKSLKLNKCVRIFDMSMNWTGRDCEVGQSPALSCIDILHKDVKEENGSMREIFFLPCSHFKVRSFVDNGRCNGNEQDKTWPPVLLINPFPFTSHTKASAAGINLKGAICCGGRIEGMPIPPKHTGKQIRTPVYVRVGVCCVPLCGGIRSTPTHWIQTTHSLNPQYPKALSVTKLHCG